MDRRHLQGLNLGGGRPLIIPSLWIIEHHHHHLQGPSQEHEQLKPHQMMIIIILLLEVLLQDQRKNWDVWVAPLT